MRKGSKFFMQFLDLTRLNENDSFSDFHKWANEYNKYFNLVASICIYSKFLSSIKNSHYQGVNLCTVINFPSGDEAEDKIFKNVIQALNYGANEFDVVINYNEYQKRGISPYTLKILKKIRNLIDGKIMKIIIETGMITNKQHMIKAIEDAISCKPDFIKTSTGKNILWNDNDVDIILSILKKHNAENNNKIGFKVAGGVSTVNKAELIYDKVINNLGRDFVSNKTFRIGSSSLINDILNEKKISDSEY